MARNIFSARFHSLASGESGVDDSGLFPGASVGPIESGNFIDARGIYAENEQEETENGDSLLEEPT